MLDGTDNFETRFVVNDLCVRDGRPWVYGACVGAYGLALAVRPGTTPCLRCLLQEQPAPGSAPTCETAGVVAPIVHVIAGIQAAEALKLLAGRTGDLLPGLVTVDLWQGRFDVLELASTPPTCPACTERRFDSLDAPAAAAATLCGRDAVQLRAPAGTRLDLRALAARLTSVGEVVAFYRAAYTGQGFSEGAVSQVSTDSGSLVFEKAGEKTVLLDVAGLETSILLSSCASSMTTGYH